MPEELGKVIVKFSNRNMRRAIMMLQTLSIEKQSLTASLKPHIPEYESYIQEIADKAA
jgi:hypothetical protein